MIKTTFRAMKYTVSTTGTHASHTPRSDVVAFMLWFSLDLLVVTVIRTITSTTNVTMTEMQFIVLLHPTTCTVSACRNRDSSSGHNKAGHAFDTHGAVTDDSRKAASRPCSS